MTNLAALQLLHHIQHTILDMDQALNTLALKEKHNVLDPTVQKVVSDLDAATTAVGNRIQKFVDDANARGSMTAAEIVAALQPEVDKLTAMGQDPNNPVPAA